MKNFFLFSVAIMPMIWGSAVAQKEATPVCCQCPKAFEGFNVGANIGYGVGGVTTKVKRDVATLVGATTAHQVAQASSRDNLRGVDGGLSVGYLHRFGGLAAGLDFTANWVGSSVSGKATSTTSAVGPGINPAINGFVTTNASYKTRLENSLQLAAKLGWVIDQVLPFIKLGWDNSQWKVKGTASFTPSVGQIVSINGSKNKRFNAFLWGAGIDLLMVRNVSLGLEYIGTAAGSKKLIQKNGNSISIKPQYNKFALTAKYIFN